MTSGPARTWRSRGRLIATVAGLCLTVAGMLTLVSYSVTLYRLFCAATGAGGTTQRADAASGIRSSRVITVAFNADTAPGLPWRFAPMQRAVRVPLGEEALVFFSAENQSDQTLVGHATFNVTPDKAGLYFKKIACFCFTEETLAPHQRVAMPVQFFVDPALAADADTRDLRAITLSYTFFPARDPRDAQDLSRFDAAAAGRAIFATDCAGCHAVGPSAQPRAGAGPRLDGVIGRIAGTAPGYPYSPALARAGFAWTEAVLDRWLADPGGLVPGTAMPVAVPDAARRQAIILYLRRLPAVSAGHPTDRPG